MGTGGTRGTRGTVAFEKAPQNFYEGDGMGGVCTSPFAHQFGSVQYMRRSFASGSRWDPPSTGSDCVHSCIVGGSMRLLWGAIAGYRLVFWGGEYLLWWGFSCKSCFFCSCSLFFSNGKGRMSNAECCKEIRPSFILFLALRQPKPENRKQDFSPPKPKLHQAISPRRRRITEFGKPNSVSRSRTVS